MLQSRNSPSPGPREAQCTTITAADPRAEADATARVLAEGERLIRRALSSDSRTFLALNRQDPGE